MHESDGGGVTIVSGRVFRERRQDNRVGMSLVTVADLVEQVCCFTWDVLCTRECGAVGTSAKKHIRRVQLLRRVP